MGIEESKASDTGRSPGTRGEPRCSLKFHGQDQSKRDLIVIGLGNEYISDDGAGIYAVRALKEKAAGENILNVEFEELAVGGLTLLDYLTGYDRCIIVDAVVSGKNPPGTIYRFVKTSEDNPVKLSSSHQIDLSQILSLAEVMNARTPRVLTVYGIEAQDTATFREGCTPEVERAIPRLAAYLYNEITENAPVPNRTGNWEILNNTIQ